ncbi:XisI protein, partial [Dolichospermum sp. LEGE 00246]|uniref:XisI protein n=1 Tax=Dolichospermum sp. LEGE 00246 TaxID=1828605 RepID=UPI001D137CEA
LEDVLKVLDETDNLQKPNPPAPFPTREGGFQSLSPLRGEVWRGVCLYIKNFSNTLLTETAEYRASISDGYNSQVLFDDEHGRYLVLDIGWSGDQYLHTTPIHVDLIDHKIWIQYDDTEEDITNDFIAAGVPAQDIVLGFRHPKIRQYTNFAVS